MQREIGDNAVVVASDISTEVNGWLESQVAEPYSIRWIKLSAFYMSLTAMMWYKASVQPNG